MARKSGPTKSGSTKSRRATSAVRSAVRTRVRQATAAKKTPESAPAGGAARAWPLRLFADRRPAAAALAERRPRRALGHPQHRALPVRPAGGAHLRRPGAGQPGRDELLLARLRRARRHLAADGDHAAVRRPRHGRAQLRRLPRVSAHHRGGQEARLGMDGPRRHQFHPAEQAVGGGGARADQGNGHDHRQERRRGAARLAEPGTERNRAHARHPCRERHRIHRQLGQRRAALSDEGEEGLDDLDALFVGAQRHSGAAQPASEPGAVRPDDLRSVRRALRGRRSRPAG